MSCTCDSIICQFKNCKKEICICYNSSIRDKNFGWECEICNEMMCTTHIVEYRRDRWACPPCYLYERKNEIINNMKEMNISIELPTIDKLIETLKNEK